MPTPPGILYDRALDRLAELGYEPGSRHWDEFWHGHRERSRHWRRPGVKGEDVCPVTKTGRATWFWEAWMNGWGPQPGESNE